MTISYTLDSIEQVAREVLAFAKAESNIIFTAPMGAGKTTLINAMCKQLGVAEATSSPTFSLVNEYKAVDALIYHFDLYRINDVAELNEIGLTAYFEQPAYRFIEWPELITPYLNSYIEIRITINENASRMLTATEYEAN